MAKAEMIAVAVAADTQTEITGGGMIAGNAGSYSLNICNTGTEQITRGAIFLTKGEAPEAKHIIRPSTKLEVGGWETLQPVVMGSGWKLFVEADGPISVQLIGVKELG